MGWFLFPLNKSFNDFFLENYSWLLDIDNFFYDFFYWFLDDFLNCYGNSDLFDSLDKNWLSFLAQFFLKLLNC